MYDTKKSIELESPYEKEVTHYYSGNAEIYEHRYKVIEFPERVKKGSILLFLFDYFNFSTFIQQLFILLYIILLIY